MKIGIDCRTIARPKKNQGSGVGLSVYELVKNIVKLEKNDTIVLFLPGLDPDEIRDLVGDDQHVIVRNLPWYRIRRFLPFLYSHFFVRAVLESEHLDVLFIPGGSPPFGYRGVTVLTVHDLAIYTHPEWFPAGQGASVNKIFPAAVRGASAIITPSTATANDVTEIFKIPSGKIKVVPHGAVIPERVSPATDLAPEREFVLCIATVEPRKNIFRLVRAYESMVASHPEMKRVPLVLAGSVGWKARPIIEEISRIKKAGLDIRYLGRVSESQKWGLLSRASVLAYPSLWEGFGLPVVEAMSFGVPVVTSSAGSLGEVAGDAAIMVDPESEAEIAEAIYEVLSDKKISAMLRERGRVRSQGYSWEEAARKTYEICCLAGQEGEENEHHELQNDSAVK